MPLAPASFSSGLQRALQRSHSVHGRQGNPGGRGGATRLPAATKARAGHRSQACRPRLPAPATSGLSYSWCLRSVSRVRRGAGEWRLAREAGDRTVVGTLRGGGVVSVGLGELGTSSRTSSEPGTLAGSDSRSPKGGRACRPRFALYFFFLKWDMGWAMCHAPAVSPST